MDGRAKETSGPIGADAVRVTGLAADVLARLVDRDGAATTTLREDLLTRFMDAVVSPGPQGMDGIWSDLRRAGISRATFADRYVPELARRLGQAWVDDCMGFADVTVGSARLQGVLREIGRDWAADQDSQAGQGTVLLIIPADEQHTLGGLVLMGQLRRRGISVALRIGPTAADLRALLAAQRFDAAMISAGNAETLDDCRALTRVLRDLTAGALRIAVGGSALDRVPDALGRSGADIATNDLTAAIRALGLDKVGVGPMSTRAAAMDRND
jgi:MerR family transcriptional regulator, light-induced transcriptional regulator